ncbi:MAG: hypothetical protein LBI11_02705 [Streptococcaceae bacterium]|jgi:hypothetical protein|nr:hypothetical protein [Streptococcaceae bacterium]
MENQTPKQAYIAASTPYQSWSVSLILPIAMLLILLLNLVGYKANLGFFLLILTIFYHARYLSKVKKVGAIRHVGPILLYVLNFVSLGLFVAMSNGNATMFIVIGVLTLILEIASAVFFLITASKIKKDYPNFKQDYQTARQIYRESRKK